MRLYVSDTAIIGREDGSNDRSELRSSGGLIPAFVVAGLVLLVVMFIAQHWLYTRRRRTALLNTEAEGDVAGSAYGSV